MTLSAKLYSQRIEKQCVSKLCFEILLVVLLITGCGAVVPQATAVTFYRTSSGNGYRQWTGEDFPLQVRVDASMDPRYIRGTEAAIAHWNSLVGRRFIYMRLHEYGLVWDIDHCIDVMENDLGSSARHKRLFGLNTPILGRDGHIISSLVEFDEDLPSEVIFEVALHEIGHALGLQHDDDNQDSIMYPFVNDHWNQSIQSEDIEAVRGMLPGSVQAALAESPGDPWPPVLHVQGPTIHLPPPCPGVHFSVWLDRAIEDDGPWGPCIGPRPLRQSPRR